MVGYLAAFPWNSLDAFLPNCLYTFLLWVIVCRAIYETSVQYSSVLLWLLSRGLKYRNWVQISYRSYHIIASPLGVSFCQCTDINFGSEFPLLIGHLQSLFLLCGINHLYANTAGPNHPVVSIRKGLLPLHPYTTGRPTTLLPCFFYSNNALFFVVYKNACLYLKQQQHRTSKES